MAVLYRQTVMTKYEFDEHSYLCWTDTPEISYVLEYSPEAVPDEEIVKMAESAETLERNK